MNITGDDKEQYKYVLCQLIIQGYTRAEITRLLKSNHFDWGSNEWSDRQIKDLLLEAKGLAKVEPEESDILYARILNLYKKTLKDEKYETALKALKELKDFLPETEGGGDEVTITFIKG